MNKTRTYTTKTIKQLYGASGGRCSRCKCNLIYPKTENDNSIQIGKIAHIVAFNNNGPRGDSNFPHEMKNEYDNLILLCSNCHDLIDKQLNKYSIESLKKNKRKS